jgi:hypothetical protein
MDLYIHSPIRLHGVVLNYISTGTTLPSSLYYTAVDVDRFMHYNVYNIQANRQKRRLGGGSFYCVGYAWIQIMW